MKVHYVVALLIFLSSAALVTAGEQDQPAPAVTLPVTVSDVTDGDTLTVTITVKLRVRLLDCWAPELKQPGGPEARDRLRELADGKQALLHVPLSGATRFDRLFTFGRLLAYVWIDGRNVSDVMVAEGHATKTKMKPE